MPPKNPNDTKSKDQPGPHTLADLFEQCGLHLTPSQRDLMWTYHGLLRRHNQELNLTRIHNFTNMVFKLYVDAALPGRLTDLPSPLMDLGSGPGMPGIPLKIMHPQLEIWLAESRAKRVSFLKEVIQTLGLTDIHIIDVKITPGFTRPMAGIISRAVESVEQTLARVQGCLQRDGQVIFMKGPDCDQEIETGRQHFAGSFELVGDTAYRIGQTTHQRRLVIFKRLDLPPSVVAREAQRRHRTLVISSESNPQFKSLKKLLTSRGIKKVRQGLMCGERPVGEMVRRFANHCEAWLSPGDQYPPPKDGPENLAWIQLSPPLFRQLDVFGTHKPLLAVRVPEMEIWHPEEGLPAGCSLLVPFQDPENVGAVIRSAAAFDVNQVILLSESAHPYHPKALRASGGTVPLVRLLQGPSLDALPDDLPILALSAEGDRLEDVSFGPSFGILAGLEGAGLPDVWRAKAVRIPIDPRVESLNAAVSVGIALYEWRRRMDGL